ncbi:hypothetical protein GCM10009827_115560 [Dactylosporangium maewongense]|uniref:Integral membrane protein n=1 Tax=Dactylosporangium maewongense TaxID=634393 RepID=A0ABP4PBI3_9ACTN
MLSYAGAWITTTLTYAGPRLLLAPTPNPTGGADPGGGFDWDKVHPDPAAVPKSDLFYQLCNAALFLGIVAAVCGIAAGAIAFSVGPIFGSHIISDRGKAMMWKAGLVALIVGSATSVIAWLLTAAA